MTLAQLLEYSPETEGNALVDLEIASGRECRFYPRSINRCGDDIVFIALSDGDKYLLALATSPQNSILNRLSGDILHESKNQNPMLLKRCPMIHHNARVIRETFDFTRPVLIGADDSFGLGDRLGIANPAHLRAVMKSDMKPILAQQSIRELQRTQRKPEEVMDAATWAALQEGYRGGFGADADHLKTPDDIDLMVQAGFTMFTIDPGEYVVNEADTLPLSDVSTAVKKLKWTELEDTPERFLQRYQDRVRHISDDLQLQPDREQILRGLLKYGGVIAHTMKMYRYFKEKFPEYPAEFELSVDETDSVTSPFEHFLVANELKRLGVTLVSLAPRFVGDFEKGIDYKGDLDNFREEYIKHVKISEALGPYKISVHSGSDKFSIYEVIGSLQRGRVHVKTAGTSYLEALRTVAGQEPELFREILDFAAGLYETEKKTYHVSAQLDRVPEAGSCSPGELVALFDQNDARQVLHVTFGKVLTARDEAGAFVFRDRIMKCLREHEGAHYENLIRHFKRHLDPFARN